MGFSSMDDWINKVTVNGNYWRMDLQKQLGASSVFVAGRWYDMSVFPGTPMLARHGELLANGQLMGSATGWTLPAGWTYANNTIVKAAGVANAAEIALTGGTVSGVKYALEYYLQANAASTIIPSVGGTAFTTRTTAAGDYFEVQPGNTVDVTNLKFTATTTTTATISNVSLVRCGRAVQLFDTDMGAMWHGGNVTPSTKHVLNAGVVSVVATFVPGTWMLVDYLKVYPGINMNLSTLQTLDNVDIVINGTFTGDTDWTKGVGWTWAANTMTKNGDGIGVLTPAVALTPTAGIVYEIEYTISAWSVGGVTVSFGGVTCPTRSANGTYIEVVKATSNATLNFTPSNTSRFTLDDVSVTLGLPRYSDGAGVRAMMVWSSGAQFAASNGTASVAHNYASMTYTAPDTTYGGLNGRGLPMVVAGQTATVPVLGQIDHSGIAANNFGPFLPMQAGDRGVMSVQSIQLSAGSGANNIGNLLLVKPLLTLPNTTAAVATERDLMNQLPSLPRIYDGAKLGWLFFPGAATAASSSVYHWLDLCWG